MWIDLAEAGKRLDVTTSALRWAIRRGRIPAGSFRKFGNAYVVDSDWVEVYLWTRPAWVEKKFVLEEEDVVGH